VIAPGVSAGGVDLSNQTVAQATQTLQAAFGARFATPVQVHVAGHRFRLGAARAKQRFDALRTAKRAYYAGRDAPPATPPGGGGAPAGVAVPLAVSHSRLRVRAFARRVAKAVRLAPRNATVRITLRHIFRHHSKSGRAVDAKALAAAIDQAFDNPAAPTVILPGRKVVKAKVTANDLPRVYGTVITIDRDHFKLRLFKHLKFSRSYPIAVGMAGLDTPAGMYAIQDKEVDPAWHVPNSSWAGSLAGQTIPGGAPDNPLKARWMGVANGVGIHGTAEDWSIGTRASHGCIRMHVSDVIDLYPRVPLGTPVLIR